MRRIHDGHLHIIQDRELFGRDMTFTWNDFTNYMGYVSRVQLMPAMEKEHDSVAVNRDFFSRLKNHPHSKRIWGYYWVKPGEIDMSIIKDFEVSGIKYHPSVSQLEVDQAKDVLDLCEDTGLPLLVHCGRNIKSRIEYVVEAYKKRSIKIIAAHLGGVSPPLVSRALEMLEQGPCDFDNFYLDTSSIDVARLIARAINVMGSDRIIFGTDIPFHEFEVLRYAVQNVWERDDVKVTSEDMNKILYGNLERLHWG